MLVRKSGGGNGVCHMWREKGCSGEREREKERVVIMEREMEIGRVKAVWGRGRRRKKKERNKMGIKKKEFFFNGV
jgi:hypothetical protein